MSCRQKCKHEPKRFWNYAKSRLKTRETVSPVIDDRGFKATTAKGKANVLNDFFVSVFTNENLTDFPTTPVCNIPSRLREIHITPEIVKKKLEKLDPNKSPGHDE